MTPRLADALADQILGAGVRPFLRFVDPPGINASTGRWYRSNFASQIQLAQLLMAHAGEGGWLLEVGSFIGGRARTFVRAANRLGLSPPIVCVDTWAGDVAVRDRASNSAP